MTTEEIIALGVTLARDGYAEVYSDVLGEVIGLRWMREPLVPVPPGVVVYSIHDVLYLVDHPMPADVLRAAHEVKRRWGGGRFVEG